MHSNHLLLEEPIRMASILEPSKALSLAFSVLILLPSFNCCILFSSFFPTRTKIVGTLGPNSRSVQVISACLTAGMSGMGTFVFLFFLWWLLVALFDFSSGSPDYHQETLENLKISVKSTKKLCAEDGFVVLTANQKLEASSELLLINYGGLSKVVKKGDTLFLGQYLFTGSETSVWLEVFEVKGDDVGCVVFLFQKTALYRCNMAGKPAVLTRMVDSMTNNLRPTRAVATDVANAVLDGSDAIILGAKTLRGLHPVETVSTVSRICAEVICVCMR
ncbi:hypothetical protein IC575_022206 [Cucumis melo]